MGIRQAVVVIQSNELQMFGKSNYQSKPRV